MVPSRKSGLLLEEVDTEHNASRLEYLENLDVYVVIVLPTMAHNHSYLANRRRYRGWLGL